MDVSPFEGNPSRVPLEPLLGARSTVFGPAWSLPRCAGDALAGGAGGGFEAGEALVDAGQGLGLAAARAGAVGEVAALEQVHEDVGDLLRAHRALGAIPLVEPVAHAEDAEHDQR